MLGCISKAFLQVKDSVRLALRGRRFNAIESHADLEPRAISGDVGDKQSTAAKDLQSALLQKLDGLQIETFSLQHGCERHVRSKIPFHGSNVLNKKQDIL